MTIEGNKTNNEAQIRELIDRFAKAFRARDVNGVMSVFAPEIVSFDILPPLQAVGAEAFVKHWHEFVESYQGAIHVEFPDVSITAGDDVAFSHCLHRVKGTFDGESSTVRGFQVQRDDHSASLASMQRFRGRVRARQDTFVLQGSEAVENGQDQGDLVCRSGIGDR
jgi:ketosteroid isomerase-like protein